MVTINYNLLHEKKTGADCLRSEELRHMRPKGKTLPVEL